MMPKVVGNDSLIARVNEVQGCMYRQSNELGRLNRAVKKYKDENAKLRERADTLEWLLKLTLKYAEEGELGGYELCDLCDCLGTCENHPAASCTRMFDTSSDFIRERMRELGIEVEE